MTTAVAKRGGARSPVRAKHHPSKHISTALFEQLGFSTVESKIDETAGIIRDVIVLGGESPNTHGLAGVDKGTKYTPEAQRAALGLYEGVQVRWDHPDDRSDPNNHKSDNQYGVLRNLRFDAANNRTLADLHYLTSHPKTALLLESVRKGLNLFSLSHNAFSYGTIKDGWFVIERIDTVHSVDLVNRGATTGTLVAERTKGRTMKLTIAQFLTERVLGKLTDKQRTALAATLEEDALGADMPAPVEAEPVQDPMQLLEEAFDAACMAILQDDSLDTAGKVAKIKDLLKQKDKVTGADAPAEGSSKTSEEEGGDEKKKDDEGKEMKERLTGIEATLKQLLSDKTKNETERNITAVCERFKFTPNAADKAKIAKVANDPDALAVVVESLALARQSGPRSVSDGVFGATFENTNGDGGANPFAETDTGKLAALMQR